MSRTPEESVRWLFSSRIDIRDVRSSIHGTESLAELWRYASVYNDLSDQLPPGRRREIHEAITKRKETLTQRET